MSPGTICNKIGIIPGFFGSQVFLLKKKLRFVLFELFLY